MKKSAIYLWCFVLAQAAILIFVLARNAARHPMSHGAPITHVLSDIRGGLKVALERFKDDCGRYPTTAEGLNLLTDPPKEGSLNNWRGPYIEPLEDPWGHEYVYRFPGIYNTNGYDLYSLGRDGISNTGDDIGNWDRPSPASGATRVYRETLSDRISRWIFFSPLLVPVLFGVRLIAGIFSRRVRVLMSENPHADRVWLWMSLAAVFVWFSTFVGRLVV